MRFSATVHGADIDTYRGYRGYRGVQGPPVPVGKGGPEGPKGPTGYRGDRGKTGPSSMELRCSRIGGQVHTHRHHMCTYTYT